jgi:hypothetical protein
LHQPFLLSSLEFILPVSSRFHPLSHFALYFCPLPRL